MLKSKLVKGFAAAVLGMALVTVGVSAVQAGNSSSETKPANPAQAKCEPPSC